MSQTSKGAAFGADKRGGGAGRWLAGSSALLLGAGLGAPASAASHYVVKPGDVLYRIARHAGVSVDELASLNGLASPDRIYAGQRLALHGRLHVGPARARSAGTELANGAPKPRSDGRYQVRRGDWLLHVARIEGVSAQALARANRLEEPYRLYVGQTLVLPGAEISTAVAKTETPALIAPAHPVLAEVESPTAAPAPTGPPQPSAAPAPAERQGGAVVLPIYDDETRIGDVEAFIDADGIVSVDARQFADLVKSVLAEPSYARVRTLLAARNQIRIVSIDNAGVITTYDPARQRIVLDIRPGDRLAAAAPQAKPAVTATGRLVDAAGAPISLASAQAVNETEPGCAPVPVFTARDGRFAASGLQPGRWRITTKAWPNAVFEIVVPEDARAVVKLGDVGPA